MPKVKRKTTIETPHAGSLTDALLRLPVGGEHALVRYLNPVEDDLSHEGISAIRTRLNSQAGGAIHRIKNLVDARYSVESVVFSTSRNRLYAAIIITREE